MASARLGVYGNKLLIEKFEEFTRKRIQISFSALDEKDKNIKDAYNQIKEAEVLASEVIALLKEKMEKLEK